MIDEQKLSVGLKEQGLKRWCEQFLQSRFVHINVRFKFNLGQGTPLAWILNQVP